jgi:hypothetical protein
MILIKRAQKNEPKNELKMNFVRNLKLNPKTGEAIISYSAHFFNKRLKFFCFLIRLLI